MTEIQQSGTWFVAAAADCILIDVGDHRRRRIVLTSERGGEFLLDFAEPVDLHDGDGLVLDNGSILLVTGAPEPLIELQAASPL